MAQKIGKKKKKNIIIVAVLAAIVIAGILYMLFKPEEKLPVETVSVEKQTIHDTLDTTGEIIPASQDTFTLPRGVIVKTVNVKEGDFVKPGDLIATFDTVSLRETLNNKEAAYEKAQSAYESAKINASQSKGKVAALSKQIEELEKEIAELQKKTEPSKKQSPVKKEEPVQVSDKLVNRFVKVSKLFGVDYSEEQARKILVNFLSGGSSTGDLSHMIDNLGTIAGNKGSFDMGALLGMGDSASLTSAQMRLVDLKAQLALLQLQSDSTYISGYKMLADKMRDIYTDAQEQYKIMEAGWKAKDKGIVSEINIKAGETVTAPANPLSGDIDISTILDSLTSGGDITSLLSAFAVSDPVAVKILYYPLVADITLSKYDVLDVKMNQDVIIKTAAGSTLPGKVSYISSVATSSNSININSIMGGVSGSSAVIPAQITIDGIDPSVIVGTDVDISVITDTVENALVVPVEAITIDGEDIFVYVFDEDEGKAVKKNVELGISNDTHYQILSGLSEKDVLIKNTTGLEDGVAVTIK